MIIKKIKMIMKDNKMKLKIIFQDLNKKLKIK